jgi:hypothetical protein
MTEWIKSFLDFKECQIDVKNLNNNDQVMLDYKKVKELLKQPQEVITPKKKIESMFYDSTDNTYRKPPRAIYRQVKVRKIVKNIMNAYNEGKIQSDKVERNLKDKLKKARKFSEDVGKKQSDIETLVARRVQLERQKQIVKVSKTQRKKEVALLKAVKQRMIQLKKKEIQDYKNRVKNEINDEKKKASQEAKTMMRTLIDAKKFSPYDDCVDNRLFNFSDQDYVSSICKRYFGEYGKNECSIKQNFCNKCCSHHVGQTFLLKLNKCKNQCGSLLKGKMKKDKKNKKQKGKAKAKAKKKKSENKTPMKNDK